MNYRNYLALLVMLALGLLTGCPEVYRAREPEPRPAAAEPEKGSQSSGRQSSLPQAEGPQTNPDAALGVIQQDLLDRLNRERGERGLPALEWNDLLARAATEHSARMATEGKLSHQFPDQPRMADRLRKTGLRFSTAAENVSFGASAEAIHLGLMNSEGHRANILSEKYNAVGIGVVRSNGRVYATQNFAYVLPEYSEEQFRDAVAEEMNRARREQQLKPYRVMFITQMDRGACQGNLQETQVPQKYAAPRKNAVVYTTSSPEVLPDRVRQLVLRNDYASVAVGACYAPGERYGSGNFWVLAVFLS